VISAHYDFLFGCCHAPLITVLAQFTHTAPQQHPSLHVESYYHRFTVIRGVGNEKRLSNRLNFSKLILPLLPLLPSHLWSSILTS